MKKIVIFIILLTTWVGLILVSSHITAFSLPWIVIALISFPLGVVLFFLAFSLFIDLCVLIVTSIFSYLIPRKTQKRSRREKNASHNDSFTEQVTLDHPDYIGILTKIDKKQIAEEYLAEQKRKRKK